MGNETAKRSTGGSQAPRVLDRRAETIAATAVDTIAEELPSTSSTTPPQRSRQQANTPPPPGYDAAHAPDRYDLAERRVGKRLDGKWTLDSLLGVGGMAAVYAATHRNGARAAIKLLPFSMATGPEVCQRLLREGYLANKIQHPAVVRVLDDHIDYDEEHAYIVMELLEGETARQRFERAGPFAPLQALELMIELCDCLKAAHAANVIHRDIKPENLFLTSDGLKVLDFGIARALDAASSLTQTGTSLGTPAYMSPEQARGKQREVTARSDIYSVGATLLFLLTGETMHDGENPMELMVRAAWTPAPRAKKRCSGLPDPIAEVIDRCCAFEPKDRYADSDAVLAALEGVSRRLSSAPPPMLNQLVLSPPEDGELPPPRYDHLAETLDATSPASSPSPPLKPALSWPWVATAGVFVLGAAWALSSSTEKVGNERPAAELSTSVEPAPHSDTEPKPTPTAPLAEQNADAELTAEPTPPLANKPPPVPPGAATIVLPTNKNAATPAHLTPRPPTDFGAKRSRASTDPSPPTAALPPRPKPTVVSVSGNDSKTGASKPAPRPAPSSPPDSSRQSKHIDIDYSNIP